MNENDENYKAAQAKRELEEEINSGSDVKRETLEKIVEFGNIDYLFDIMETRLEQIEEVTRPQLLILLSILLEVKSILAIDFENHCFNITKTVQLIQKFGTELQRSRIQWDFLEESEVDIIKKVIEKTKDIGKFLIGVCFASMGKPNLAAQENNNNAPKDVSDKIESIAKRITFALDLSDCNNEKEVLMKRLNLIEKNIDTLDGVKKLETSVESLKNAMGVKEETEVKVDDLRYDDIFKLARSVKELTTKVCEFEYRQFKDGGQMICVVCGEHFKYSHHLNDDFSSSKIRREFSNLKTHLKDHLQSMKHRKKALELKATELINAKEESRNTAIGLRIGRLVYHLVFNGRPDTDLPLLVLTSIANGCDMGDLNHSK